MSAVAVAVVGGAVIGAVIQGQAAKSAADTQAGALQRGQDIQERMFEQQQKNEQPFIQGGQQAMSELSYLLGEGTPGKGGTAAGSKAGGFGSLNAPFTMDTFKKFSPAYQFQLQQGGQGVLNANSSAQGAESGAALKDLMSFNQQFANTSFNNAFNQYQTQQSNTFSRLMGVAGLGSWAGSPGGTGGPQYANMIGNTAGQIGTAQAAGQIGVANAWSGATSMMSAMPWLMANSGGGGAGGGGWGAYGGGYG